MFLRVVEARWLAVRSVICCRMIVEIVNEAASSREVARTCFEDDETRILRAVHMAGDSGPVGRPFAKWYIQDHGGPWHIHP